MSRSSIPWSSWSRSALIILVDNLLVLGWTVNQNARGAAVPAMGAFAGARPADSAGPDSLAEATEYIGDDNEARRRHAANGELHPDEGRHQGRLCPDLRRGAPARGRAGGPGDRKSTRLNSSHGYISYAVFCLKK